MLSIAYFINRVKKDTTLFYPVIVFFFFLMMASCSQTQVPIPKPRANKRIDIPQYNYKEYHLPKAIIEYSDMAKVQITNDKKIGDEFWFDIVYPSYNAVLHCTYLSIDGKDFSKMIEDNHLLVYSHVSMADGIRQSIYENSINHVQGILYEIDGEVATPIQFYATDSVANFIRGSLYYENSNDPNNKVSIDSVQPITSMIQKDVKHLLQTLQWHYTKR